MLIIVLASHIDAIFLDVIAVVSKAIDILFVNLNTSLNQLQIFIIAHRQNSIERTRHK